MKIHLSILFIFFSLNSFGQQFLWTTNKNGLFPNSEMKIITNSEVLDKLKIYHDSYDYYYDGTGFTKEGFFRMFESSNTYKSTEKTNWELFQKGVSEINDLTISCIKFNEGNGSSIGILIVNKDNFDLLIFSNNSEEGMISTLYGFPKFEKFYKSIIED